MSKSAPEHLAQTLLAGLMQGLGEKYNDQQLINAGLKLGAIAIKNDASSFAVLRASHKIARDKLARWRLEPARRYKGRRDLEFPKALEMRVARSAGVSADVAVNAAGTGTLTATRRGED